MKRGSFRRRRLRERRLREGDLFRSRDYYKLIKCSNGLQQIKQQDECANLLNNQQI